MDKMKWIMTGLFILAFSLCGNIEAATNSVKITCQPRFETKEGPAVLMDSHGREFNDIQTWLILKDGTRERRVFWKSRISPPPSVALVGEVWVRGKSGSDLANMTKSGSDLANSF
jgi:hypothetical protein